MQNLNLLNFLLGSLLTTTVFFFYHRFRMGSYDKFFKRTFEKQQEELNHKKHQVELEIQAARYDHQKECDQKLYDIERKTEEKKKHLSNINTKLEQERKKNEHLQTELHQKIQAFEHQENELSLQRGELLKQKQILIQSLENLSNLSQEQAEEKLFEKLSLQVKKRCALWESSFFKEIKAKAEKEAKKIISSAINRLAAPCTSQATTTLVHLPNEDFKSKIVGREGRNIHFLENLLGVNLLMDETPKSVIISATDPLRKAIAKTTLQQLIRDGRIHPTRIEEEFDKATQEIEQSTRAKAEDYAISLGVTDLHPKIIELLAKMDLMNSLGQNLLDHSYQVANIMNVIASELELNSELAKRIGFLHDIGKAAPSEIQGSHALIGHQLCLKYGESEELANGVGCHHGEMPPISIEGSLCSAADTISASRAGARTENVQHYFKRMKRLENIAYSFPEIEKAYVLQAGKEIRVIAKPEKIDDASLTLLAQSLAQKIEKHLNHPEKIKVSVFRQRQVVEFAFA